MDNSGTRNWNVLCWNVRGLNSATRQRAMREKLMKANVLLFVYMKQNAPQLMQNLLGPGAQEDLINLLMFLLLVLLGD